MLELPESDISYWKDTASSPEYPMLSSDLAVDVVVVGGGITGLTAAYMLKKSGQTVAVLEKHHLSIVLMLGWG